MAEGRRISKVYQVVAKPRLIVGVDYKLLVGNVSFTALMVVVLHVWWWLICAWLLHQVLKAVARRDALMRQIFIEYQHQADHYDPWPVKYAKRGLRPKDIGREELR